MIEKVEEGQYYRNKKTKNIYMVINIVVHSETLERMVLYMRATGDDRTLWVRPMELFKEKFEEM